MRKILGLVITGLLSATVPTADAAELTLDHGHVDVFTLSHDGALNLHLREDATGHHVTREPADVLLRVPESALSTDIPAELPITQGYVLPLTQDPNLLWPGWDTTGLSSSANIIFEKVEGPGPVYLLTTQGLASKITPLLYELNTNTPTYELQSNTYIHQAEPGHVHAYWIFSEPGTYIMDVYAQAGDEYSQTKTYTWQIGTATSSNNTKQDSAPRIALPRVAEAKPSSPPHETSPPEFVAADAVITSSEHTPTAPTAPTPSTTATKALPNTGNWPLAPFLAFFALSWCLLGFTLYRWGHRD
ncbi:MAG: choice-of-anchor M domain-containing protein [Corynebacterium sp.]|nr:choice-of-anchor M domain-containing protein [Corynebacterium sp.]